MFMSSNAPKGGQASAILLMCHPKVWFTTRWDASRRRPLGELKERGEEVVPELGFPPKERP